MNRTEEPGQVPVARERVAYTIFGRLSFAGVSGIEDKSGACSV